MIKVRKILVILVTVLTVGVMQSLIGGMSTVYAAETSRTAYGLTVTGEASGVQVGNGLYSTAAIFEITQGGTYTVTGTYDKMGEYKGVPAYINEKNYMDSIKNASSPAVRRGVIKVTTEEEVVLILDNVTINTTSKYNSPIVVNNNGMYATDVEIRLVGNNALYANDDTAIVKQDDGSTTGKAGTLTFTGSGNLNASVDGSHVVIGAPTHYYLDNAGQQHAETFSCKNIFFRQTGTVTLNQQCIRSGSNAPLIGAWTPLEGELPSYCVSGTRAADNIEIADGTLILKRTKSPSGYSTGGATVSTGTVMIGCNYNSESSGGTNLKLSGGTVRAVNELGETQIKDYVFGNNAEKNALTVTGGTISSNGVQVMNNPSLGGTRLCTALIRNVEPADNISVKVDQAVCLNYLTSYDEANHSLYLYLPAGVAYVTLDGKAEYFGRLAVDAEDTVLEKFVPVTGLTPEQSTITVNRESTLQATLTPENASVTEVAYKIKDPG